jgi:NAD(P)-dependent dehydrogenase (short-subunit alcohol dehydrogenase family)
MNLERLTGDTARLKKITEKYIIRRSGRPDDVANTALYLATGASSSITARTYPVNGGYSLAL